MTCKLHTCGKCEHLMFSSSPLITSPYCGKTEEHLIVPHQFDGEIGEITLTRVPDFCKNENVVKSPETAPRKYHVTVRVDELPGSKVIKFRGCRYSDNQGEAYGKYRTRSAVLNQGKP